MRRVVVALLTTAALAAALPAAAQTPARARIGFRAYGIYEGASMQAEKSFKAILDSQESTLTLAGAGGEVTNLWKGLFARVAFTSTSVKGSRVFVDGTTTTRLNIPMTIEIAPVEIGVGWRFGNPRSAGAVAVQPFVGAAILNQRYKETSDFASADENVDVTDKGRTVFAGVEIGIKRLIRIGIEAQFRDVPDTLGVAGVSKAFNETNLGGAVFRLTFGVGF